MTSERRSERVTSEDGSSITVTDTKSIVVRSFVQAGPWALLAVLVIMGVGYEAHAFLSEFVLHSARTMDKLTDTTEALQQGVNQNLISSTKLSSAVLEVEAIVKQNAELVGKTVENGDRLIELLNAANAVMRPVAAERQEQTQLLRDIKNSLEQQRVLRDGKDGAGQ